MNHLDKKKLKEGILKTIKRLSVALIKKGNKYQGANLHAVTVLSICCFIDAMSKYIYGDQANECNFKRFIEKYMPKLYSALIDKADKEGLVNKEEYLSRFYRDVRCGLVHEYFPKSTTYLVSQNCKEIAFGNRNELKICIPRLRDEWERAFNMAIRDV